MTRRHRILLWAAPLLMLNLIAIAVLKPHSSGLNEEVMTGFVVGSFFGHSALASAWAAFGPGTVRWRLPLSVIWVVLLPIAFGINIVEWRDPFDPSPYMIVFFIGAYLVGQWLLMQLLLWPLAIGCGLRIRYADDVAATPDQRKRQFSVRQLMIATGVVGVLFGVGRGLLGWLGTFTTTDVLFLVFPAIATVLFGLPLLLAGLLPRRAIPAVITILVLIGFGTVCEATLLAVATGGTSAETGIFMSINAFTAATILVGVLIVRLNGYGTTAPGKLQTKGRTD